MSDIKFELKHTPDAEEQKVIRDGIVAFNQAIINDKHKRTSKYKNLENPVKSRT